MTREPPRARFVPPPPARDEIRLPEPEMAVWPDPSYMVRWRELQRRRRIGWSLAAAAFVLFVGFLAWLVLPL